MIKKRSTLLRRRSIAIVAILAVLVVLAIALAFVLDYVRTTSVTDPVDGTVYYIRYKDKMPALYDTDKKTLMPTESTYGYYVLRSGTLLSIDQEDGTYQMVIVDETVDTEKHDGYMFQLMMFPHISGDNVRQIEVSNSNGTFVFHRYNLETGLVDNNAKFVIKGSPLVDYSVERLTALYTDAGYTIVNTKINDPIKDESGEFSEYGLVPEIRPLFDKETGEPVIDPETGVQQTYEYTPAYYILTDTSGNKYKVIIGDRLVTGGGYYAQYVDISTGVDIKRDAVYVMPVEIANTILVAIEDYVTPKLTYPMQLNNYFDVADFYIYRNGREAPLVGFNYIDLLDREKDPIRLNDAYEFTGDIAPGYRTSFNSITQCLQSLYDPAFSRVVKLAPSGKDMLNCGLAVEKGLDDNGNMQYEVSYEYMLTYNFKITDDEGNYVETINNTVYFSKPDEVTGKCFAYTEIYEVNNGKVGELAYSFDIIVELEAHSIEFLKWDEYDWINEVYFELNIAGCDKLTISAGDYWASFDLDNSATPEGDTVSSDRISISATQSDGATKTTFSVMKFYDVNGGMWEVTGDDINYFDAQGKEQTIQNARYDHNILDEQVLVLDGFFTCADGTKVYVSNNEVTVEPLDSSKRVVYTRYDTTLFRRFYTTLLRANIINSYELSKEEQAMIQNDPSRKILTLTVTNIEGEVTTYKFYRLSARKAFMTINDRAFVSDDNTMVGFYVMTNRLEKFVSDAQKFFANQIIDPTAKT
jgi:hypothetical protein